MDKWHERVIFVINKNIVMTWIIVLIALGVILFFVELFFVPGTTLVGILGVLFAGVGVYIAYTEHSTLAGNITLSVTLVAIIITIIIGAKSKVWEKLSNKDAIQGRANIVNESDIKEGDRGVAISAIRPIGKARINDMNFEVRSLGEYIDSGTPVEVTKVKGNHITIKIVEDPGSRT